MIMDETIEESLEYDATSPSGLKWKIKSGKSIHVGAVAGCLTEYGYYRVSINRKLYAAHRIVWFLVKGEWPTGQIDHINGIGSDNRIENLRVVNSSENNQNKKAPNTNSSGFMGVSWNKKGKKWEARIKLNGKQKYLGYFSTPELAYDAYLKAKSAMHPCANFERLNQNTAG